MRGHVGQAGVLRGPRVVFPVGHAVAAGGRRRAAGAHRAVAGGPGRGGAKEVTE